ncbi:MAG: penicillin-binding protein 2 [Candidatus Sericytochromatia bacterium]|nr:penicillin-binding protein 2 [Candidatus Tanganyikabacteria bacterium]
MDSAKAQVSPRFRTLAFSGVIAFLILLLMGRLFTLQVVGVSEFRERAEGNRLRVILEPAPRGVISDRHGQTLAASRLSYSVTLYPIKLTRKQTDEVIDRLGKLLGVSTAEVRAKREKASSLPVRVLSDIDERTIALIAENQHKLPGVSIDPVTVRHYPRGRFAAHLLGYTGEVTDTELEVLAAQGYRPGDVMGRTGLERVFDIHLRGVPGRQQVEVDNRGRPMRTLAEIPPIPGKDLRIALDAELQEVAERELEGKIGAIVCLEPSTGEILALASSPDFDPNMFAGRIKPQDWRAINSPVKPLLNRAISSAYPPGSIFKIVTSVAAMEAGVVREDSKFMSTGVYYVGNRMFRDWKEGGFGRVDFHKALVMSIDTVYYELGLRLGPDRMAAAARAFGLGSPTGILLGHEAAGLIPDSAWKRERFKEKWYPGESANMSIGQGWVNITPIQAAVMIATVANGGRVVRPKLALPPGEDEAADPGIVNRWKPETWKMVRGSLADVVSHGTGTAAKVPGYTSGGKTGSAEAVKGQKTHGWFVCYSPADKPRIAISVLLEKAGHGGSVAAPIAGKLLRQFYGIPEATASPTPAPGAHYRTPRPSRSPAPAGPSGSAVVE